MSELDRLFRFKARGWAWNGEVHFFNLRAAAQIPYRHEPRPLEYQHRDYQVHDAQQRGYWPALLAKRIAEATAKKFA